MIPLGSCTMKLNAASEMIPITWPEANSLHPFVPADQSEGIREMLSVLSDRLAKITGFAAVSLQPNAGAAGEYAGLLAIRRYQKHAGEGHRNVCLISHLRPRNKSRILRHGRPQGGARQMRRKRQHRHGRPEIPGGSP